MCLSKCFAVYSCFVYGWNVIVVSNQGSNPLGLVRNAPNLRGIPDNLPAFDSWQIYSLSLDLSRESDKSACILVLIRTALTLVLIYSDSPRPEINKQG